MAYYQKKKIKLLKLTKKAIHKSMKSTSNCFFYNGKVKKKNKYLIIN